MPALAIRGRVDYVVSEEDKLLIAESLGANEVSTDVLYLDHYWREATDFETVYRGLRSEERPLISNEIYSAIVNWLTTTG